MERLLFYDVISFGIAYRGVKEKHFGAFGVKNIHARLSPQILHGI